MRKLLIFLAIFLLMAGMVSAQWYPRIDDYVTTGDLRGDNLILTGDAAINGSIALNGSVIDGGVISDPLYVDSTLAVSGASSLNATTVTDLTATGEINQVGNLSNLTPSAATDLVVAINEVDDHADTNAGDISDLQGYVSHLNVVAGGAAGNHTLTGAAVGDALSGVIYVVKGTENLTAVSDLTAEFTGSGKGIIDDDVIANGGGTDTTGGYLIVGWIDKTA